jgi:hypothetical protein
LLLSNVIDDRLDGGKPSVVQNNVAAHATELIGKNKVVITFSKRWPP